MPGDLDLGAIGRMAALVVNATIRKADSASNLLGE